MSTAAPPDYSQVVKERDEFQRDVTAAGIAVEGPPPNTSYLGTAPPSSNRPMASPAPQSVSQSPYPADKSGQRPRSTAQYAQPAPTPAMGYGAIQSGYSVPQQQQVAGAPLYYYQNAAGHTISSPFPPNHIAVQCPLSRDGRHHVKNYYGVLGVVVGILFFPLGCIWTALDHQTRCKRCGEVIDTGCYSC